MLWYEIEKLLSQKYNIDVKFTQKEALFGYPDVVNGVKLVNTFVSIGKQCISKFCNGKYSHLTSLLHLELTIRGVFL